MIVSRMQVDCLSSVRVYIQKDLRPMDARKNAMKCVSEAVSRLTERSGRVPMLDPKDDIKVREGGESGWNVKMGGIDRALGNI